MNMRRVVVYAEGAGELTGRDTRRQRRPGTALTVEELGSAHLLVRRCLQHAQGLEPEAIQFEEPLRGPRGQLAKGSMLHSGERLRQFLSWPDEDLEPHLAIILIDADGQKDRQQQLAEAIQNIPVPTVLSAAIQEFEAWLIADEAAVKDVLRKSLSPPKPPERLGKRQAKELLQTWCAEHAGKKDSAELRRQLAETCDLNTVSSHCTAFADFLQRLGTAARP
jgi:hypothetical protein